MRDRQGRHAGTLGLLAAIVATLVLGCGSAVPTPSASRWPTASPTATKSPSATARPTEDCGNAARRRTPREGFRGQPLGMTVVRWFVGLGPGTQPAQIEAEKAFVKQYNARCGTRWYINLEIVPNDRAYDILKTQIAAGNAPDIIGPVGVRGLNGLGGQFLDMAPLVEHYNTNLGDYEPAVVDFLRDPKDGLIGLPYTIYPGYIFYNKDLFEAAGLPDLPHEVGEKYLGREWTWETLTWVAERLTVDTHGRTAIEPLFDANNVVQYGFTFESADARRIASCFGGGSFVADDGRTAQIPPAWAEAWKWYYQAMWTWHIAPPASHTWPGWGGVQVGSGRIAMEPSWPWAVDTYGTVTTGNIFGGLRPGSGPMRDMTAPQVHSWDIAVMPAHNGQTSSPMDADTFVIWKGSSHPDEAYRVMRDITADPGLMAIYGGVPARKSMQAAYFAALDAKLAAIFPGNKVDWSVVAEMSKYPAVPSHEADMPNATTVIGRADAFQSKLESQRGLDYQAELDKLRADIQKAFDRAAVSPSP
jgi:multiple sugar transport system substrate-binding protein